MVLEWNWSETKVKVNMRCSNTANLPFRGKFKVKNTSSRRNLVAIRVPWCNRSHAAVQTLGERIALSDWHRIPQLSLPYAIGIKCWIFSHVNRFVFVNVTHLAMFMTQMLLTIQGIKYSISHWCKCSQKLYTTSLFT